MEHLFEPKNSKVRNLRYTKNGIIILNNLLTDIYRLRTYRVNDDPLLKYLDFFESSILKLERTIIANPRFVWQELQDTFDYKYKNDKSITGADVQFNWNYNLPLNRLKYHVNL